VLFDSGVRRGSQVFKALACGADAAMIGRPFAYGLGLDGQPAVEWVLENIIAEFDLTMGLAGYDDAAAIDSSAVRHERTL
jgi:lactate 2-monooxygenase